MARNGRYAPAQSIERSQTAFAANGAPSSTPTFVRSSKQREDKRSAPSTPSASPCEANRCIAPLERPNGNVSNYGGWYAASIGNCRTRRQDRPEGGGQCIG